MGGGGLQFNVHNVHFKYMSFVIKGVFNMRAASHPIVPPKVNLPPHSMKKVLRQAWTKKD